MHVVGEPKTEAGYVAIDDSPPRKSVIKQLPPPDFAETSRRASPCDLDKHQSTGRAFARAGSGGVNRRPNHAADRLGANRELNDRYYSRLSLEDMIIVTGRERWWAAERPELRE